VPPSTVWKPPLPSGTATSPQVASTMLVERTHGWSHEGLYGFARVMFADGGQAAINIALR
jgi:hypothetical protein